ncbi:zinc finger protein 518B [Pseudophryne corroboree]|uniref:zinc finger protein 518B n=1 Tax=Pseudophryne corroboree TaxID=495146 RepID=UPI003081D7E8
MMNNSMLQMQMPEKYNCEKCRFSTKDPNKYRNHVSLHNDIKYACSHCTFVSYTKTEFQRHLVSHTGKFPYTCEYCGYGAIRNDYIVKHIKRIHGDGKIQCSVSTVESESINASVNIIQTQVRSSLQEIFHNSPFVTEDVIDLTTDVDNFVLTSNGLQSNGNNIGNVNAGQVEVEVVSPVGQQLYPWMPLTVVAPTTFRVPANCVAEVVEVKSMNSTCHLVLKYSETVDSFVPNRVFKKENPYEPKPLDSIVPTVRNIENPTRSSLQECTASLESCNVKILHTKNAATVMKENSYCNVTCPPANSGIINTVSEISDGIINDVDLEGPIISSVFSLSSDSQNIIEGIQWECPTAIPQTSPSQDKVNAIYQGLTALTTESHCQMEIEKANRQTQTMLKAEQESPETKSNVFKDSIDHDMQSPLSRPALIYSRKPESQTSSFLQSNKKGWRKSNRFKMEPDLFSRPQTLFLSCDRRIVMQPLSCMMQNGNQTAAQVLAESKVTEQEWLPLKKTKKQSSKAKVKTLPKKLLFPTLRGTLQQNVRTLRLFPLKADQVTRMPYNNQPVVVLNHPDLESLEISYIMKAVNMFKGKVLKMSLSKQMCKKYV